MCRLAAQNWNLGSLTREYKALITEPLRFYQSKKLFVWPLNSYIFFIYTRSYQLLAIDVINKVSLFIWTYCMWLFLFISTGFTRYWFSWQSIWISREPRYGIWMQFTKWYYNVMLNHKTALYLLPPLMEIFFQFYMSRVTVSKVNLCFTCTRVAAIIQQV